MQWRRLKQVAPSALTLTLALLASSVAGASELYELIQRSVQDRHVGYDFDERGVPAGIGYRWHTSSFKPLPRVSGNPSLGGEERAFLKGTLCFVPPTTRSLTGIKRCRAEGILYAPSLDISRAYVPGFPGVSNRYDWFVINYVGTFETKGSGRHLFRLRSQGPSMLWVNGVRVVSNDGARAGGNRTGALELEAGAHHVRVLYMMQERSLATLQLFVTPPGQTERVLTHEF